MFNRHMLRYSRELAGLSKTELAERIGCTVSAVSQFESGAIEAPDDGRIDAIARELGIHRGLLMRPVSPITPLDIDACHFRAMVSTSTRERRQAVHQGALIIAVLRELEELGVEFPRERVSDFTMQRADLDTLASALRRHWGLGLGPIPNLIALLESKGVVVLPLGELSDKVDAFSTWAGERPCMFLGLNKAASRTRFDAAHELAHLLFHHDVVPGDRALEEEADRFAGAFLLPRETFAAECPRQWNLDRFVELKRRWRVSIAAMVMRGRHLGLLTDYAIKQAFKELSYRQMRKDEPAEPNRESPVLLEKALELVSSATSLESLSYSLGMDTRTVTAQLSKCVSSTVLAQLREPDEERGNIVHVAFNRRS